MSLEMQAATGGGDELSSSHRGWIDRITSAIAVAGGLVALAVALLATASVLGRWLFNKPIEGDFEFVKMATAVAVFAYLPFTQIRRGNIIVDTFTGWLPARVQRTIDAFWDIVYALVMGACAYALVYGTFDTYRSGETTMQLQIALWPTILISTVLCMLLAAVAVVTAVRVLRARTDGAGS